MFQVSLFCIVSIYVQYTNASIRFVRFAKSGSIDDRFAICKVLELLEEVSNEHTYY